GVNKMAEQLQDLIGSLEKRIEARTEQLKASAEVGRVAASILDTEHLLREVVELITARFGFYYAAIFLTDDSQHWAVLHEATGEAGHILKERQHKLEIGGQSMVGNAIINRRPRIALDVGTESTRFANPLLPETRSEIALPLIVGERVLGALDVQSTQAAAFDETYASVLQSMTDQIAIALSNTQQFTRTESALRQTNILYAANRQIAAANNANDILQAIVTQAAPDADRATLVLFGPANERGEYAYLESIATYANHTERVSIQAGQRYEVNQLPLASMVAPDKPAVIENITHSDINNKRVMRILNTKAALALSLTAGPKNLGAIVLGYRQPRHFSPNELQTLQTLANQAAVSLQNQQLLTETQNTMKQLDAINRRLTGEAWQAFTQATGVLQTVAAGPGVSALNAPGLQEVAIAANQVKTLGPIGDARSALIAPIALRGQVIGSLSLQETNTERQWTENEMTLLQTVANDVAVAIDNARLIEQTDRRAERERIIIDVNSRMLAANDLQGIVQIAGDELARALNVARAKVQISAEYLQSSVEQDTRVI
ncbi:MAG TPA: GAF domain-containing protein, partial [Anaerolineae bacterium]|nr:GAF domain-containing protein [Anaerolineae bacterium]